MREQPAKGFSAPPHDLMSAEKLGPCHSRSARTRCSRSISVTTRKSVYLAPSVGKIFGPARRTISGHSAKLAVLGQRRGPFIKRDCTYPLPPRTVRRTLVFKDLLVSNGRPGFYFGDQRADAELGDATTATSAARSFFNNREFDLWYSDGWDRERLVPNARALRWLSARERDSDPRSQSD